MKPATSYISPNRPVFWTASLFDLKKPLFDHYGRLDNLRVSRRGGGGGGGMERSNGFPVPKSHRREAQLDND